MANGKFRFYFIIINTYFNLIIMIICIFLYNNRINILLLMISGVARGVAGVAEATPIFQILFNKFGLKKN